MTDTRWRIALAVYVIFWFLTIAMEHHGLTAIFHREPMTGLDLILTVPFFWGYGIYALQNRLVHWTTRRRLTVIERDDRPIGYWLIVAIYFLYGVFLLALGLNRWA